MRYLVYLAVFSAIGCGPQGDPTPLPTQDAAVKMIWSEYRAFYGNIGNPPPVYWRRDRCGEPNGIYGPSKFCTFGKDEGTEVDNATGEWIEVGAPSFAPYKIGGSALAHELAHAAQARMGIDDTYHARPEWVANLPLLSFQIVPKAEKDVIDAGF